MSEKILVPDLGESITEATVSKWLKNKGDKVTADEAIVELETDKVNLEVPSPVSGLLTEVNWKDGDVYFNYPQTQFSRISVYGTNMNELLENGEKVGLTHIMATSEGTSFFNFVNQLYFEDTQYPFLINLYEA